MHAIMACDHGAVMCKLPSRCSIDIKVQHADCGILDIAVEKEKERRGEEGQRDKPAGVKPLFLLVVVASAAPSSVFLVPNPQLA